MRSAPRCRRAVAATRPAAGARDGRHRVSARRRRSLASAALVAATVVLAACETTPPLYRWGIYEDLIYRGYRDPGSSDPVTDAARLSEDVERTRAEGRAVPPGVHAHLGYLYYSQGDLGQALAHLERERELFPESAVFVDGMLARIGAR